MKQRQQYYTCKFCMNQGKEEKFRSKELAKEHIFKNHEEECIYSKVNNIHINY